MIDPVPYHKVRGVGFYRQFLDNSEWGAFMRAGRELALTALHDAAGGKRRQDDDPSEPSPVACVIPGRQRRTGNPC